VQDMIMQSTNTWMTKNSVKQILKPRKLTSPDFMIYLSRMPNIYGNFDTHDYLRRYTSSLVEQLFSEAEIHISEQKLLEKIRHENTTGGNAADLEKLYSAINGSGYISVPYLSGNKVTGRLFPSKSVINPVTLSDEDILETITTRFDNGSIVVLDFKTFEPKIIGKIINYPISNDLHQLAADVLQCSRDAAKKVNNMIFYGSSVGSIAKELTSLGADSKVAERYLDMMFPIMQGISTYRLALEEEWARTGYITTIYGRRVWVKSKSAVLNNAIQAAATDIFNAVALRIFDYLRLRYSKLFMHRFDSYYIDVHPDETEVVDEIADIMRDGLTDIEFDVSMQAGRNLNELRTL